MSSASSVGSAHFRSGIGISSDADVCFGQLDLDLVEAFLEIGFFFCAIFCLTLMLFAELLIVVLLVPLFVELLIVVLLDPLFVVFLVVVLLVPLLMVLVVIMGVSSLPSPNRLFILYYLWFRFLYICACVSACVRVCFLVSLWLLFYCFPQF